MPEPAEPTQAQRRRVLYMCYGFVLLGAIIAIIPSSDPKAHRIGFFLMVLSVVGAVLVRKRMREVDAADQAFARVQRELDSTAGDMEAVLARHGVTLEWSTTDPQNAFLGGMAKASFYNGCKLLDEKKYDDALASFTRVIALYKNPQDAAKLVAAAHCLRASAHEAKGDLAAALVDYKAAQTLTPDNARANEALARLK